MSVIIVILNDMLQKKQNIVVVNGINILKVFEKDKIGVYIDGEVCRAGFIQIPKDSTLEYALNRIGGVTKNADIEKINVSKVLKNGEKILIPRKKTEAESEYENLDTNVININKANKKELKTLEGIGEKTAEKIIEYRNNKKFSTVEEIMEVKGIGESKFKKIKENITV